VKNAGFAWDETSFAAFIANPRGKIPGNKMVFAGIKDEIEIANLCSSNLHAAGVAVPSSHPHRASLPPSSSP
jgi:cytochrome c2